MCLYHKTNISKMHVHNLAVLQTILYHSCKSLERHHYLYKPHVPRPAFQARVHPCTLGYMRVAGQLWSLLKTVKQLAGTTKATMAQVICFCFPFQFSPFPVRIYYCVCYSIGLHSTVAQQKVLNVSLISHLYCPPYCSSVVKYSVNLPVQSCLHLQLDDLSGTTLALRSTPTMVSLQ